MNDRFRVTSWAVQETGMLLLLSCDSDMTASEEGFRCVRGRRGRPCDTKATGDSKDQLGMIHAHKCSPYFTALQYISNLETKRSYKRKVNLKNLKFLKKSIERFKNYSLIC